MKRKIFGYLLVASFTGFLIGFDAVVISGVNLPVKHLWNTSDWFHGIFIISISLWGTLLGSLFGGYPTEKLGRKTTLILVGLMFTVSGTGNALATTPAMFSVFRFMVGVSAGIGSIVAPTYIAELAKAEHRGKSGMLFQVNIVLGILLAFISNYFLVEVGDVNNWRLMLGVIVIPAGIYTALLFRICESPRWLILKRQDTDKVMKILPLANSEDEVIQLLHTISQKDPVVQNNTGLFSGKYTKALVLSFLIAFFNQFSGISFVLLYAPEILEKSGFENSQSLLGTISIGLVNLAFTLIGMYLIDRIGRKPLMYLGTAGYIISLFMIAYAFYSSLPATFILVFILIFIFSHAIGQGAVIWVFIAEIFPTKVRAFGQAWGTGLLNGFAAIITLFGSVLIHSFAPWIIFSFFAFLMILQGLFVRFLMPETKGTSLEELESVLAL